MAKKRGKTHGGSPAKGADDDAPSMPKPTAPVTTGLGKLLERAGLKTLPPEKPRGKDKSTTGKPTTPLRSTGDPNRAVQLPPAPEPLPRPAYQPPAAPTPTKRVASKVAPPLSTGDLSAWNRAMGGVQPLRRKKPLAEAPARPPPSSLSNAPLGAAQSAEDDAARARLDALVGGGVRFEVSWDLELVQALRKGAAEALLARAASTAFAPEAELDLHRVRAAEAQRSVTEFVRSEHRRGARKLLVIVGKGLHSEDGYGVLARAAGTAHTHRGAPPPGVGGGGAPAKHGGSGALAVILK